MNARVPPSPRVEPGASSTVSAVPFSQASPEVLLEIAARSAGDPPHANLQAAWRWEALMRPLTADERRTAELYYREGLTMVEIARTMRVSESTAHRLHSHLIDKLRRIGDEHEPRT